MERLGTNRPDLADVAVEYSTSLTGLVGLQVFPAKYVPTKTGEFDKILVSQQKLATGNLKRARKAAYPEIEHTTTSDTWTCVEYALAEGLDRRQDKPALDRVFDSESAVTNLNVYHLMLQHEVRVAAQAFDAATNFTAGQSNFGNVGTEWNNSGNVYNDVQDTKLTLKQNLGGIIMPGAEVCGLCSEKVFKNIKQNSTFKALIGGGQYSSEDYAMVSAERAASILELDRLFVSAAQHNGSDVWDDEYFLIFVRRTDDMLANGVQLGRTFVQNIDGNTAFGVETWSESNPPVDMVGVYHLTHEKPLTVLAGYLLGNITT